MFKKKTLIVLVSLLAVLCVTVGGTLAFLADSSDSVTNTFQPSRVTTYVDEKTDNGVKTEVRIQNTGDIDAYIRAAVVITWKNDKGEVYGQTPVEMTAANPNGDYTISYDLKNGWSKVGDYYYWKGIVKCDDEAPKDCYTGVLITSCSPVANKAPDGYSLSVEIIGSGIQADGVNSNKEPAVQAAWGDDAAKAVGAK